MNWLAILVGHSCVGKTSIVRLLASLSNRKLVEFSVNNATDTSDLLGGFEKTRHLRRDLEAVASRVKHLYLKHLKASNRQYLKVYFSYLYESKRLHRELMSAGVDEETACVNDTELVSKLLALHESNLRKLLGLQSVVKSVEDKIEIESLLVKCQLLNKSKPGSAAGTPAVKQSNQMKFEWIDSSLVKAIENGDWVLIDNANFCPPSVLDRLNPLLERNGGILQINEKGKNENFLNQM
jgi:midasin